MEQNAEEVKAYLRRHGVPSLFNTLLEALIAERPDDVHGFLTGFLQKSGHHTHRNSTAEDAIEAAADKLLALAHQAEPAVSAVIQHIQEALKGKLIGFDKRFKSRDSLIRKIKTEIHLRQSEVQAKLPICAPPPFVDAVQVTNSMGDALRFTLLFSVQDYTECVLQARSILKQYNFDSIKLKNYWGPGDNYQGINDVYITHTNLRFEVQYHTPESFEFKESTHKLYEEFRVTVDPIARQSFFDRMNSMAQTVKVPDDIERLPVAKAMAQPTITNMCGEMAFERAHALMPRLRATLEQAFPDHLALNFRQATLQSICRLLNAISKRNIPVVEAMRTLLPNTIIVEVALDVDGYTKAVVSGLRSVIESGFKVPVLHNHWLRDDDAVQGIHAEVEDEEGWRLVELRLLTPACLEVQATVTDTLSSTEITGHENELFKQFVQMWAEVEVPKDSKSITLEGIPL